jgi:hypothetical protein
MEPTIEDEDPGSLMVVQALPLGVSDDRRREVRCQTDLPLRLTSGSGEIIPAVIRNLSATGLFAMADERFSLLLPPPDGARFEGEFFFGDIEARNLLLEIVRVDRDDSHQVGLGCQFVLPPSGLTMHLRATVLSRRPPTRNA